MKFKKFKLPKTKFQPTVVLTVLLAVAVLAEVFILYKYLYLSLRYTGQTSEIETKSVIMSAEYDSLKAWVKQRKDFSIAPYDLAGPNSGRENPFAEY